MKIRGRITLTGLLLLLVALPLTAQEPLLLRVTYHHYGKNVVEEEGYRRGEMVLEVGPTRRNYYDRWDRAYQIKTDSVTAAGGGMADYMKVRSSMPRPGWREAVYTNYPTEGTLTGTAMPFKRYYYEEPVETPQWRLLPDTMTILGYPCRAAETDFRGRTWRVWYAPDIAVDAGPWKLHGLPGLILRAEDSNKEYMIDCIGLSKGESGEVLTEPYLGKKYIRTTREKIREETTAMYKDFKAFQRSIGLPPGGWGPDGKPLKYPPRTAVFMDY